MSRKIKRERCCRKCFAYIPFDSRKCEFCGYKYKSPGKYLLDKIAHALKIDRAYSMEKVKKHGRKTGFFTAQEIDAMLNAKKFQILMYLVLDDIAFLDETSLIELGEMLTVMYKN